VFRFAEWPEKWGAACADPLVADGKVFVSTAEQHQQCARFTIDGRRLKREWANRLLPCYTGGVVLVGGHVYGVTKVGLLKCVDWATGKEKWSQREFGGHGAISAADGKLFVINSRTGELTVAAADPAGFQQLRKSRPFRAEGETFTAPTLADGRVYCRSYRGEVVCLEVGGGE
jgi:outer membrane protein assembly factor BamB